MRLFVQGIGIWAPGLTTWPEASEVLTGRAPYAPRTSMPSAPASLPPRERRRSTITVRLALEVGRQACEAAGADPTMLPSVFSSSSGDLDILDYMCKALANSENSISPTRFHNSVHNAPAGYWTIGTGCHASSSSLSAGDDSFAAGILEAGVRASCADAKVLLVAYDAPAPFPINEVYPVAVPFGVALLMTSDTDARPIVAVLDIEISKTPVGSSRMRDDRLESLRCSNPIALALPVLAALAGADGPDVHLALGRAASLSIRAMPCL